MGYADDRSVWLKTRHSGFFNGFGFSQMIVLVLKRMYTIEFYASFVKRLPVAVNVLGNPLMKIIARRSLLIEETAWNWLETLSIILRAIVRRTHTVISFLREAKNQYCSCNDVYVIAIWYPYIEVETIQKHSILIFRPRSVTNTNASYRRMLKTSPKKTLFPPPSRLKLLRNVPD